MPIPGTLGNGMEVQGPSQTLEYLTTVALHVCKCVGLATGSVTGQMLVDAGLQVMRPSTGGHSYLYWPDKLATPMQCFNCMQAAKLVIGVEGWQQAVGLKAAKEPASKEAPAPAFTAAAQEPVIGATDTAADSKPAEQDAPAPPEAVAASGDGSSAAAEARDKVPTATQPPPVAAVQAKLEAAQAASAEPQPTKPLASVEPDQQQQQEQQQADSHEKVPATTVPPPPAAGAAAAAAGDSQQQQQQRKQVQFQPVTVPPADAPAAAAAGSAELLSPSASTAGDEDTPKDAQGGSQGRYQQLRLGWGLARPDKEAVVLDGLAQKLSAIVNKNFTGVELRDMGLRAVKEARSLRRQYSLWWPEVMTASEPIHCIPSYHWAAVRLLADASCRQKLGVTLTEAALQQAAAAAAASGGSAKDAAAAAAASSAERVPGKRKRARDGVAAAAAAAGDDGMDADAEYIPEQRSPKRLKQQHLQNYVSQQHHAAAGVSGGGGILAQQKAPAADHAAAAAPGGQHRRVAVGITGSSSTEEVLRSVKSVMQELSEAVIHATTVSTLWQQHPEVLQKLPGYKVLTEGADKATLDKFISDAKVLRSELKQDRSIFKQMVAAHTAAGANGSSSSAAAAAAKRKPFLAFRDALAICVGDAVAWLQHSQQQKLIDRAQAIVEVRDMQERYQHLLKHIGEGVDALVKVAEKPATEQQQQQRKGSGLNQKSHKNLSPKAHKNKAAAAAKADTVQQPAAQAARQQQQQHDQPRQQVDDEDLQLLQQQQRYNDVVAAAAQAAAEAAAAAAQQQQQPGSGLSGPQGSGALPGVGSAGGTVLTFLQQFMNG